MASASLYCGLKSDSPKFWKGLDFGVGGYTTSPKYDVQYSSALAVFLVGVIILEPYPDFQIIVQYLMWTRRLDDQSYVAYIKMTIPKTFDCTLYEILRNAYLSSRTEALKGASQAPVVAIAIATFHGGGFRPQVQALTSHGDSWLHQG